MNNFNVVAVDTDSIFFKKADQTEFTKEEQQSLMKNLNSLMPNLIKWEMNGYFRKKITVKTKNYVLWDGETLKHKGSALKASTKEPALKQFIKDIIQAMLDETNNYTQIYKTYVKEINNVQDITRWASRKTITSAVLTSERTNETKVKDALNGTEYVEGDRAYFFFKGDDTLCLVENFNGDYNKDKLLKKLYDTAQVFSTILDTRTLFPNLALKKNKQLLENIINEI